MALPMIAGLCPYARGGVARPPLVTLQEIPVSLAVNPSYRSQLIVLAGDATSALGEFLWVDWDTVCVRDPDEELASFVRATATPRFIGIPGHWATVNGGVYDAHASWTDAMDESLPDFWWGARAVHVESEEQISWVTSAAWFAHVKRLEWAPRIRAAAEGGGP